MAELHAALAAAAARIVQLEQIIQDLQRARFGQSAERVDPGQLALTLWTAAPLTPAADGNSPAPDRRPTSVRHRNRGCQPAHPERVEEVIDNADRACPCCGREMHRVSEDRAERLGVVPAQLRVCVTIRPRYACRRCEEGVPQSRAPARIVAGGLPTEGCWRTSWSQNTATACQSIASAKSWPAAASSSTGRRSATRRGRPAGGSGPCTGWSSPT
ncbi:IS66 family transposase zinc-finger binding domain-containing protein [Dankookia rubra]